VLLVVTATAFEAALVDGAPVRTVVCGIGPVEAALATSRAIADDPPAAILQVGIAGARQEIVAVTPAEERQAGEIIEDDGTGAEKIVAFLEKLKVV